MAKEEPDNDAVKVQGIPLTTNFLSGFCNGLFNVVLGVGRSELCWKNG